MNIYRVIVSHLLRKADPVYEHGLERERWKPSPPKKLKPWRIEDDDFENDDVPEPPNHAQSYLNKFEVTLDPDTAASIEHYSGLGHQDINRHLRGELTDKIPEYYEQHVRNIDKGMDRSPLPESVIVWRGVDGYGKRLHPIVKKLASLGVRSYKDSTKALGLRGFTFTDPSYVSTSFNKDMALMFTDDSDHVLLEIKVPAGTQAIYLPGSHSVTSYGDVMPFNGMSGETELLLDRGLTFKVTHVAVLKSGAFLVKLEVIG